MLNRTSTPARRVWPRALMMLTAVAALALSLTLPGPTPQRAAAQDGQDLPGVAPAPAQPLTPQDVQAGAQQTLTQAQQSVAAQTAPAQSLPTGPTAPATPEGVGNLGDLSTQPLYKLQQMFMFSPVVNGIIAGLSILAVMFFLWFLLTINGRTIAPPAFVNEITNLVLVGRYEAAADACRRSKGVFIAPIILRCVENHGKSQSIILGMIDSEGRRLSDIIWNRISYLADISNVAPMLGLLGTVMGMITAFFGLDKESGTINSSVLSQGVGQAMATTMFGLMVGITTLVFYSIVKSRATKTLAEAEAAVHSIADRIRGVDEDVAEKKEAEAPSAFA